MADLLDKQVHTPVGDTPIVPVLIMVAGAYLCWFGVHYWRTDTAWPTDPIKAVLQGKPLPEPTYDSYEAAAKGVDEGAKASGASTAAGGSATTSSYTGPTSAIAAAALKYVGAGYVFGGNASSVGNWDCSSFTSYVLGHDLGINLPGGKWGQAGFPPHAHGPATGQYMLYGTSVQRGSEKSGDLIISSEHMGIVLGGGQYVSARTPALGVGVGSYESSFPGGNPVFRRVGAGSVSV